MASPQVAKALQAILSSSDKAKDYAELLATIQKVSSPATLVIDLGAIIDGIFSESLGIVATRQLLSSYIDVLRSIPNNEAQIQVGQNALNVLQAQASSFEESTATIREIMATAYENDEEFEAAANILKGIPLESSQRSITDEERVRVLIRITRNYLEVDETVAADTYLNKAKAVMYRVQDRDLNLHFKLSQARIQDSRREFLQAAAGYQDISTMAIIAEEERLHTLSMAIKCAVLAPAGPQRGRTLARLYKDERCAQLEEFGILEKMFLDRLLTPEEVAKFAEGLAPHQLAKTSEGLTVLAKAVVEHNLLAASRLYSNISFDDLGLLLGLDGDRAEETTAKMIEQGRLDGRIDQIDRIIWFESPDVGGERPHGKADLVVGKELRQYDANVQGLSEEVEKVTSALQLQFPDFVFIEAQK